MSKSDKLINPKVKRNLYLNAQEDVKARAAKRPAIVNTAVEITEYSTKQWSGSVNKSNKTSGPSRDKQNKTTKRVTRQTKENKIIPNKGNSAKKAKNKDQVKELAQVRVNEDNENAAIAGVEVGPIVDSQTNPIPD